MGRVVTHQKGFTIVELIVVVVVLAIIATITAISYGTVQDKTRQKKIETDIQNIIRVVKAARLNTGKTLKTITGSTFTGGPCAGKSTGTDLASLSATDTCITTYTTALAAIATAANMTLGDIRDPWGRPYLIDENESELGLTDCTPDTVAAYRQPFITGLGTYPSTPTNNVPISGFLACP